MKGHDKIQIRKKNGKNNKQGEKLDTMLCRYEQVKRRDENYVEKKDAQAECKRKREWKGCASSEKTHQK